MLLSAGIVSLVNGSAHSARQLTQPTWFEYDAVACSPRSESTSRS